MVILSDTSNDKDMRTFEVRDRREKGWFYIDNEYLNGFAKHFGAIGTAIYVSLCRHADGEQKCYPSQKLIAEELNIGERTVRNYLNLLVKYNIIEVERKKTKEGKWLNNVYYLVKKSHWTKPQASGAYGQKGKTKGISVHSPEASDDSNQRHVVPTKKTNGKNTNIRRERRIKNNNEEVEKIKREISRKYKVLS